jgi:TPR repeat protein
MSPSYSQPIVPPLYFDTHNSKGSSDDNTTSMTLPTSSSSSSSISPELPSEVLSLCLTSYADWGDLAKLSCVQKSWSNMVMDTANQSSTYRWELAQALLDGDCGLRANPMKAVQILKDLANIPMEDVTGRPITTTTTTTTANDENRTTRAGCFPPAMKKIAECYLAGVGVEQNAHVAVEWLEATYLLGMDADAAHETALIYEYGRHGIEVDVVAAAVWFEKAANAGNVEAMTELGLCYELGCGVEQSDERALDWYTKAANLGHPTAKFSVGEIFEEARGVPQSDEEACLWYYRAALAGDEDSKVALRRLYDIARIVVPGVGDLINV